MEYLSIRQTAEKWGISGRRIQRLCTEGRIPGATKIGSYWAVPVNADKPKDKRITSGRYCMSLPNFFYINVTRKPVLTFPDHFPFACISARYWMY